MPQKKKKKKFYGIRSEINSDDDDYSTEKIKTVCVTLGEAAVAPLAAFFGRPAGFFAASFP